MFPSASAAAAAVTTDCCVVDVISHCSRDKCSELALSRVTQPRRGSWSRPGAEFTHPETAGSGGDGGGGGGGGRPYVNGIVTGAAVVVHPLVLLFSFLRRFL